MDLDKRLQMIRLCEAMECFPDFSRRIGLINRSTFRGQRICQEKNTPPLSTEEPA
ncbi:MAG: hypothetical protein J6T40_02670 [Clostridiales bacterium]|nr:hypothetical protein [Clostridiales bacterium]